MKQSIGAKKSMLSISLAHCNLFLFREIGCYFVILFIYVFVCFLHNYLFIAESCAL